MRRKWVYYDSINEIKHRYRLGGKYKHTESKKLGTRVVVKCTGDNWTLPSNMLTSINTCDIDGLHLESNNILNFEYDYPYEDLGLQIECYVLP